MFYWLKMVTRKQVEKIEEELLKDIDKRIEIMQKVAEVSKGLPFIQYFDLQIRADKRK